MKKAPGKPGAFFILLRGQDLNLRPLGYEPSELPSCSTPRRGAHSTQPPGRLQNQRNQPEGEGDGLPVGDADPVGGGADPVGAGVSDPALPPARCAATA